MLCKLGFKMLWNADEYEGYIRVCLDYPEVLCGKEKKKDEMNFSINISTSRMI